MILCRSSIVVALAAGGTVFALRDRNRILVKAQWHDCLCACALDSGFEPWPGTLCSVLAQLRARSFGINPE